MSAPELIELVSTLVIALCMFIIVFTCGGFLAVVYSLIALQRLHKIAPLALAVEEEAARSRRLRLLHNDAEVPAPAIEAELASHQWAAAQDKVRVIKQRLNEQLPGIKVFLDVDDLEDIGDLEGYIKLSGCVLVFCSRTYFESRNCMVELRMAVKHRKPIIALLEAEMTKLDVLKYLVAAEESYARWGFEANGEFGATNLHAAIFTGAPIEWNSIGVLQDVTVRLVGERLLPSTYRGGTYLQGEISAWQLFVHPPLLTHHVYCSPKNLGAAELIEDVKETLGLKDLLVTSQLEGLDECDHMLVYLTNLTWTSASFAEEVALAMQKGVHLLLAHEMPGADESNEKIPEQQEEEKESESVGRRRRPSVPFSTFFTYGEGGTPLQLVRAGIYQEIAVPLKGGAWRKTSLTILAVGMGAESTVGYATSNNNIINNTSNNNINNINNITSSFHFVRQCAAKVQNKIQGCCIGLKPRHNAATPQPQAPTPQPQAPTPQPPTPIRREASGRGTRRANQRKNVIQQSEKNVIQLLQVSEGRMHRARGPSPTSRAATTPHRV